MRARWISECGKGPGEKQTCERVKRMEKYMLVPERVETIEIVQGQGLCLYSTLGGLKRNWCVLDLRETENK